MSKKEIDYNPYLLNEIQPQGGIKFEDDKIVKGDGYEACLYIYGVPVEVDEYWLKNILNNTNTIATLDIATEEKEKVLQQIEKSLFEQESRYKASVEYVEKRKAEKEYQQLQILANEVIEAGEVVKLISLRIFIAEPTREKLEKSIYQIRRNLETERNFTGIVLLNEQNYEYQSLFTGYSVQKEYENKRSWKPIPALSLGAGVPFHHTCINDPRGLYIGTTTTGGSVLFDLFHKTNKRLSYSCLLVGKPGAGKSTTLKKLILNNAICGNFIRVIDVTGEFGSLITELGGKEIYLDGEGGIINPLQIYPTIMDEKTNNILEEKCFTSHISKLTMMYRTLKPRCEENEIKEYEILLSKFYKSYGIEKSKASRYNNKEYPILGELLEFIKDEFYDDKKNEIVKANLTSSKIARMEGIILTIESLIENYGDLFNGYSSIDDVTKEQLISYNCSNLKQLDKSIFVSQLFTTLSSIWGQALVHGRKEKYDYESGAKDFDDVKRFLVVMDEGHNFINVNNMDSVNIIISMIREFRKFFSGFILANHNISDYVPENSDKNEALEEIKKIFSMTQYKFIMRQDISSKELLKNIFKETLSESEINAIPNLEEGQCILCMDGVSNVSMKIEISKEEDILFEGGA